MKVAFLASFLRDIRKLKNRAVQHSIEAAIQSVEETNAINQIASIKRLSGHTNFYRLRVGDYRLGMKLEKDTLVFVRCLHRREIYRFFP
ncbi:MAG: type II toxin-antitoxin system RelE/ParE family toxin [Burkholderiales bacterium]|nr:type II toxin-antitoxin system RelE/ParE family toxin [Phycisphaerae bacterium]